ncbi:MAG: hypothetical protein WBG50_23720 [Desulfomonilaceae bacterium]
MADQPLDDKQRTGRKAGSSTVSNKKSAKDLPLKAISVAAALMVGLVVGYVLGILVPVIRHKSPSSATRQLAPVFSRVPENKLFSSTNLFEGVGASPVNPAAGILPSLERSPSAGPEKTPKTGPCGQPSTTAQELGQAAPKSTEGSVTPPSKAETNTGSGPKSVETPVIVTREPGATATEKQGKSGKKAKRVPGKLTVPGLSEWDTVPSPPREKAGKIAEARARKKNVTLATPKQKNLASREPGKAEQFQLPGSLLVRIHNYSGTPTKWGLMVILDDSVVMARKVKPWTPSRSQAAENFVAKLAGHLTPGSKIAVRDFLCRQPDGSKKPRAAMCLSHILYDWTSSPFTHLKEKLDHADFGGHNNPCAAAAYSLKKDIGGNGALRPRILIVTAGTTKCASKQVVKAAEQYTGKDKLGVDVVALGMRKKTQAGYSHVVDKTNGLFLTVDRPADVDSALSRYGKLLKTRTVEKVEVRGDQSGVFSVNAGEEITLPPGTYTAHLPVVAGLNPSKRSVPNIRIVSGVPKVLDVRIRKGKPIVRSMKK